MSDAIADGDKIWALIRGSAISQEGVSKSIGTPTIHSESLSMELALKDANVQAKDVSFVETHGELIYSQVSFFKAIVKIQYNIYSHYNRHWDASG